MNDHVHTIVGVLPAFPQYPRSNDVYMPTSACPFRAQGERTMQQNHRTFAGLRVFGRLRAGATADAPRPKCATIASGFDEAYPRDYQRAREFTGRDRSRSRSSSSATRGRCCSRSRGRPCSCC